MTKEMETGIQTSNRIEFLPEGIENMPALESSALLARAFTRINTLGWKGELWDGVSENLRGASARIDPKMASIVKKTLSAVVGISLLTSIHSCTNGPNFPPTPSETYPRITEVQPTTMEVAPASTETQTPTATNTPIPENTATPEAPKFDFSLSINPDKIPLVEKWFVGQPDQTMVITTDYMFAEGFISSYRLVSESSGPSLYVEFVYYNSVIRAKIDNVYYMTGNVTYIKYDVNNITPEEASQISSYLNDSFEHINNFKGDYLSAYNGYFVLKPDESTAYNISTQELSRMFNNSLVPITNNQIENFAEPEKVSLLLSSKNKGFVVELDIWPRP